MTAFAPRRTAATWAALGAACLGLATAPASAVQLGQVDSFAAGLLAAGLAGWRAWHFVRFAAVNPSVRPANRSEAMHHRLIRTAVAHYLQEVREQPESIKYANLYHRLGRMTPARA